MPLQAPVGSSEEAGSLLQQQADSWTAQVQLESQLSRSRVTINRLQEQLAESLLPGACDGCSDDLGDTAAAAAEEQVAQLQQQVADPRVRLSQLWNHQKLTEVNPGRPAVCSTALQGTEQSRIQLATSVVEARPKQHAAGTAALEAPHTEKLSLAQQQQPSVKFVTQESGQRREEEVHQQVRSSYARWRRMAICTYRCGPACLHETQATISRSCLSH
jgi:hypothetical protein